MQKLLNLKNFPSKSSVFKLCNTTFPKPCKILKHVLFPDEVLSLNCIYVLVTPSFFRNQIGEATKSMASTVLRASL